ncbi:protein of unknown function [Tenacibaculum aestuariivivum]
MNNTLIIKYAKNLKGEIFFAKLLLFCIKIQKSHFYSCFYLKLYP